ncbi:MAG: ATP-grasp domain-containing protein [Gammaproteobacteria bacterium]|jgi:biotin carboxylase
MTSSKKNIFVFGADDFNLSQMQALDKKHEYRFHTLFQHAQVKAAPEIPVKHLYKGALEQLENFPGSIDAIVGYWDFPVSTMLPLLCRHYDLPAPDFEAVLKCEHKYWSRLEQSRVIPEYIPRFCAVDPFADNPRQQINVEYPFWIKPVKSATSFLGFKVHNDAELEHVLQIIRKNIFRFANPFNYLLQFADLPDEIAGIDGNHCIVESIISRGRQCTLEGYVYEGEVVVYGAIDSIREGRHRSSFARYQYPSTIPQRILRKMVSVTERFLKHIAFDNGPFNIEFYWERSSDEIWLLEINTRISKSHCPLFRDVDGQSHHKVMLDLALGQQPAFPHRQGNYRVAAKFMWRIFEDALVQRVPSREELQALNQRFPSAEIQLHIDQGMRLSDLKDQDSYSYEVAVIFLAANNQHKLLQKYRDVQHAIPIELEAVD